MRAVARDHVAPADPRGFNVRAIDRSRRGGSLPRARSCRDYYQLHAYRRISLTGVPAQYDSQLSIRVALVSINVSWYHLPTQTPVA